jgi:hypothetical protein
MRKNPDVMGWSGDFNTHAMAEVIVGFDDDPDGTHNGMDSMYTGDLEVLLSSGEWKFMPHALRDHDLITDDYNTHFFEPANEADRERGYTL